MVSVSDVLARLDVVRPVGPDAWFARCPCHHERTGSLSVRVAPGSPPFSCHCFGCGAGTRLVLEALGLTLEGAPGPIAPDPDVGTPEWYALAHEVAVAQERAAARRREGWWGQVRAAGADLHRDLADTVRDLHAAAERLGPCDHASWTMLDRATHIEAERRLLEVILERTP